MPNLSTFDPRNIVGQILRKYKIPQFAFFCLQYESRVSRYKIERALRGEVNVDTYEAEHLVRLARECAALADSFPEEDGEPCQLEWRDTPLISTLLKRRKEQGELGKQKEEKERRNSTVDDFIKERLREVASMITLTITEKGIETINLSNCRTAEEVLRYRLILDRIASNLMRLDGEIKEISPSIERV